MKTNSISIFGNLGGDIELKTTPSGIHVVNFSIAESYASGKDENNKTIYETRWHKLVTWGHDATYLDRFATKGMPMTIKGHLDYEDYNIADKTIKTAKIVVEDILLHSLFNHSSAELAKGTNNDQQDNNWKQ